MSVVGTVWSWLTKRRSLPVMLGTNASGRVQWPPAEEQERIRRYDSREALYRGDHVSVFDGPGWKFIRDKQREYLSANLLGTLTDLLSWRLMGEGIEVNAPEDAPGTEEFFDAIYHRSCLDLVLLTAAEQGSYCGDTFLKVRYDAEEEQVVVESVDPSSVVVEWREDDAYRVAALEIGQVLEYDGKCYLWKERHELRVGEGWIVNSAWALHGDGMSFEYHPTEDRINLQQIPQTAALPEEQATGVDGLLVVHIPNKRIGRQSFGVSDYAGLEPIQGEINHRLTQRAEVLDKFVDPVMYGPDISGPGGVAALLENKYIATEPGQTGVPVGYVVWDAQLTAVVEELRELVEQFATTAKVDMQSLLSSQGGGPVSGRAIRLSQMRTQATVQAKQKRWEPGIREVFSLASKLAAQPTTRLSPKPSAPIIPLSVEQVAVRFNDGLPTDRLEDIQEQIQLVEAGLQTKTGALQTLFGLTVEEADAMAATIAEEHSLGAPTPPAAETMFTSMDMTAGD